MSIDPHYHRYIGKVLKDVADDLEAECKRSGYTLSVMDKSFPRNIDVEPKRLNVFVDDEFHINRIWLG